MKGMYSKLNKSSFPDTLSAIYLKALTPLFLGMGLGPLELGKIAPFCLNLGKVTMFFMHEVFIVR